MGVQWRTARLGVGGVGELVSETQTASLTDWLLACIAEDEAVARRVQEAPPSAVALLWGSVFPTPENRTPFDPARVLALCEAHRRIVEWHEPYRMASLDYCSSCGDVPQVDYPCPTLRALAVIYADHPDYRAEWAL